MVEEEKSWIEIIEDASNRLVQLREAGYSEDSLPVKIELDRIVEAVNSTVKPASGFDDSGSGDNSDQASFPSSRWVH